MDFEQERWRRALQECLRLDPVLERNLTWARNAFLNERLAVRVRFTPASSTTDHPPVAPSQNVLFVAPPNDEEVLRNVLFVREDGQRLVRDTTVCLGILRHYGVFDPATAPPR